MITVHIEHQIRSISITLDFEIDTRARYEHASETATINKNTTVERHSHTSKKKMNAASCSHFIGFASTERGRQVIGREKKAKSILQ